jgi:hypothetical protein
VGHRRFPRATGEIFVLGMGRQPRRGRRVRQVPPDGPPGNTIADSITGDRCPATSYNAREITGCDGEEWFGPKNSPRHRWLEGGTLPDDARQAAAAGHHQEKSTWAALHHDG